jgi:uncharacterized OB-fold protein
MDMWKCHTERKQLPIPDEDSLVFWEGCRRHRLLIQQCDACQTFRFPPSPICRACLGDFATWQEDRGEGEVLTFCVYHSELAGPPWQGDLPYVVGVIQLWQSGVKMLSRVHGHPLDKICVGLPVQVRFEVADDRITLPMFVPLNSGVAPAIG